MQIAWPITTVDVLLTQVGQSHLAIKQKLETAKSYHANQLSEYQAKSWIRRLFSSFDDSRTQLQIMRLQSLDRRIRALKRAMYMAHQCQDGFVIFSDDDIDLLHTLHVDTSTISNKDK